MSSDGLTFIVGLGFDNNLSPETPNKAQVFEFDSTDGGEWKQKGVDIELGECSFVGDIAVAMNSDGDRIAVSSTCDESVSGFVRVLEFNDNSGAWQQRGMDIAGESADDSYGYSVDMNDIGDVIAVSAIYNNNKAGHVRVLEFNDNSGAWQQRGMDIDGDNENDLFGTSVALSADGNKIVIGAVPLPEDAAGRVKVYEWSDADDKWTQLGQDIIASNAQPEDYYDTFGESVVMNADGTRIVVGSPSLYNYDGFVHIYNYDGDEKKWISGGGIDGAADTTDMTGSSLAMNAAGDRIAVGNVGGDADNDEYYDSGFVSVFEEVSPGVWNKVGDDIKGGPEKDFFGSFVTMNDAGSVLLTGGYESGTRVYIRSSTL